ncbi:MAG: outer membrane lipoprotein LolB [Geobacter sp.]|nr:outer membrane lipoprotein LolB [Geobacter sp.]
MTKNIRYRLAGLLLLSLALILPGCATHKAAVVPASPDAPIEAFTSRVSITLKTADGKQNSMGGVLAYRAPDRFRFVVLSPFGLSVADIVTDGQRLTCLIPSRNIAFAGTFSDLPERHPLRQLAMLPWVVERPKPGSPGEVSTRRKSIAGLMETVYFNEICLPQRRVAEGGAEVRYDGYQPVDGVMLPTGIELANGCGDTVTIRLDEPEVNQTPDDKDFTLDLTDVTVVPLTEMRGF